MKSLIVAVLAIPDGYAPLNVIPLGYPAEDPAVWIVMFYTAGFTDICMEGVLACIPVVLFSAILTIGMNLRAKCVRRFGAYACAACLLRMRSVRRWLSE